MIDMRWKAGKIISLEVHAKSGGAIRLTPPPGQTVAGIHTQEGRSVAAEKDGAIRLNKGISYEVKFR
jgi:uncharacterized protein (AIM24 family)